MSKTSQSKNQKVKRDDTKEQKKTHQKLIN
jgi:hypothetical protein